VQRSHDRLIFLHGFLGSPEDWDGVISFLPEFHCEALTYPFQIPPDGILIGYSMGGRRALRYPHPKIVLSAHPGLKTPAEKSVRRLHDQKWLDLLHRISLEEFIKAWYQQPLFKSLKLDEALLKRRLNQNREVIARMLTLESLANQSFYTNATFLYGELDTKFAEIYKSHQISAIELKGVGHACHLENPKLVAESIKLILLNALSKITQ